MDMVTVIPVKHIGILTVNMLVILVISLTSKISKITYRAQSDVFKLCNLSDQGLKTHS